MSGVWIVERWSVLLRAWIPVSAVGVHYTMNKAKLASRALSRAFTRVRVRNLDGGEVYTVRGWIPVLSTLSESEGMGMNELELWMNPDSRSRVAKLPDLTR